MLDAFAICVCAGITKYKTRLKGIDSEIELGAKV